MGKFDKEIRRGVEEVENAELLLNLLKTYNGIDLILNGTLEMIKNGKTGKINPNAEINKLEDSYYNTSYIGDYQYDNDSFNLLLKNFSTNDYLELEDSQEDFNEREILFLLKNDYILKYKLDCERYPHYGEFLKISNCKGKIFDTKFSRLESGYYQYYEKGKIFALEDSTPTSSCWNRKLNMKNIITCEGKLTEKLVEFDNKDVHSFMNELSIYDIHDKMIESRNTSVKKLVPQPIKNK